jgi:SAM-dependent methyltransferase
MVPANAGTIVDLGAGTGALTRQLVGRAEEVVAVEPDDRMRSVLIESVPTVRAVNGRGESMPLPDGSADAVLASSSWHWMDPAPTLAEVARVLVPGGILGAVWSGPDPEGPLMAQAQAMLADRSDRGRAAGEETATGSDLPGIADLMMGDARRISSSLEIPTGSPFEPPEHEVFTWDVALTADEMVGLVGTLSWVITLPDEARRRVLDEARQLLGELLGVAGDVTIDVAFRADAWRSARSPLRDV